MARTVTDNADTRVEIDVTRDSYVRFPITPPISENDTLQAI
jgi:hypothetical protein